MKLIFLLLLVSTYLQANIFVSEGKKIKQSFLKLKAPSTIWGFDFITPKKIIFTTKMGRLYTFDLTNQKKSPLLFDIPNLYTRGQGGLLDIIVNNKVIYITYSASTKEGKTTNIASFRLNNKIEDFKILYTAKAFNNNSHHFGSRLLIKDNYLYATIGDRGERDKAQDRSNDHGSVIRINLSNNKKENFTKGHRNPQGLAISPFSGQLINGEFGPQGGDEINLLKQNANYGWPIITYGEEYGGGKIGKKKKNGLVQPLHYWKPSLSFSGVNFYTGKKLPWTNNLFLACLATQRLQKVVLDENHKVIKEESLLEGLGQRIRMVRQSPDQKLYFSTDSGKLGFMEAL